MRSGLVISSLIAVAAVAPATSAADEAGAKPQLGIRFTGGVAGATGHIPPIEVVETYPDSAASLAGLLAGDILLAMDGAPLRTDRQVVNTIQGHAVGDRVALDIERDGRLMRLSVVLRAKLGSSDLLELRLLGSRLPAMSLRDRHDESAVRLDGQPALLVIFDAGCEACSGPASDLATAAQGLAVRTIVVGEAAELKSYMMRNPVVGLVSRWQGQTEGPRGMAVLSGLNSEIDRGKYEGAVLVVDAAGVVQFAASTADVAARPEVRAGALAAAVRVQQRAPRRVTMR